MDEIKYKLNIICPNDGWILEKIANELFKKLNGSKLYYSNDNKLYIEDGPLDDPKAINYYINYYLFKKKSSGIDIAFFTHYEEDEQNRKLTEYFFHVAKQVDYSIFMSSKYEKICKNICKLSSVIIPGVDEKYKSKLNLGIVGRSYDHTSRKNPILYDNLSKIEWLNIEYTQGKISEEEMPNFYNRQDYILVLSKVEGGPMCVLESLAMGKKIIFPKDVGFGEMFSDGLFFYEKDNFVSLINILEKLFTDKKNLADLVRSYTWEYFAAEHNKIFSSFNISNKNI